MTLSHKQTADVIVIGGGISGLTTAYMLQKQGRDILLLEKSERFGGAIRSDHVNGFLVEAGPNSTLETNLLLTDLIHELGIENQKIYANETSKKRFILKHGTLVPLPMSPQAFFLTPLFSMRTKLGLLREPFIPPSPSDANESIADFVKRRLGNELLDYAINPFVAGVYAGDPTKLGVRAAFPKLFELEQKYGSLIKGQIKGARERRNSAEQSKQSARMFSFRNGMQTLTDALSLSISRKMASVEVTSITKDERGFHVAVGGETFFATALVVASQAAPAARLCKRIAPEVMNALDPIAYPPVAVVITAFTRDAGMHPLDGFGFLIPEKEKRGILGTIFSSSIFSDRILHTPSETRHLTPDNRDLNTVSLTSFVGGMRNPENALLPKEKLTHLVLDELRSIIGTPMKPTFMHVTQWERAIPQYTLEHLGRMDVIEKVESGSPGLFFCANYRGGISVGDCVKSADAIAKRVLSFMNNRGK